MELLSSVIAEHRQAQAGAAVLLAAGAVVLPGCASPNTYTQPASTVTVTAGAPTKEAPAPAPAVTTTAAAKTKAAPAAPKTEFQLGDTGKVVQNFQVKLVKIGCSLKPIGASGIFDIATDRAVKTVQTNQNLPADGVLGPVTEQRLNKLAAQVPPASNCGEVKFSGAAVKGINQAAGTVDRVLKGLVTPK